MLASEAGYVISETTAKAGRASNRGKFLKNVFSRSYKIQFVQNKMVTVNTTMQPR